MRPKKKCYIYTRVSTSMQVDGYSLDAQKDKLRKYAEFQEFEIAGEYSDVGKSGKNVEGRPEFLKMLRAIEDGKDGVSFVLVFKLSRFGRNAADVLTSLQRMQDYGVNLICVEDGIDSSKDFGKLMISVLSAVAEIERENILVQTMEGRRHNEKTPGTHNQYHIVKQDEYMLHDGAHEAIVSEEDWHFDDPHYDRKYQGLQERQNTTYDEIVIVEADIADVQVRLNNIRQQKILEDNVYQFLLYFDKLYDKFSDAEKKEFISSFIESVEIYPEKLPNGRFLKRIEFRFPVFFSGQQVDMLSWDKEGTVKTCASLSANLPQIKDSDIKQIVSATLKKINSLSEESRK